MKSRISVNGIKSRKGIVCIPDCGETQCVCQEKKNPMHFCRSGSVSLPPRTPFLRPWASSCALLPAWRGRAPQGAPFEAAQALRPWCTLSHRLLVVSHSSTELSSWGCGLQRFVKRALDRKSHASCWNWPEDGRLSLGCEAWPWTSDFTPRVPFLTGYNPCAACLTGRVRMAGAEKGDACETLRCCRYWSFPGNAHIVYHFEVCYCFLETGWLLGHSLTSDLPVTSHSYQHSGTFEKTHDYVLKW